MEDQDKVYSTNEHEEVESAAADAETLAVEPSELPLLAGETTSPLPTEPEILTDSSVEQKPKPAIWKHLLREMLQTFLMAMVLYLLIDSVVARVRVENISMEPSLWPGEFILVNKAAYRFGNVQRGDIIVFHYPPKPSEDYIKRVLGVPGDIVNIHHGQVYVNEILIEESYINEAPNYVGTWQVPEGEIFVLGDNRNQSSDSHNWGFVPYQNVVGKAILIYWPLNKVTFLTQPYPVNAAR